VVCLPEERHSGLGGTLPRRALTVVADVGRLTMSLVVTHGNHTSVDALLDPAPAPLVRFNDTAGEDGTVGVESLAGDLEPEFVESAEGGQIGAGDARADGSVGHVEVFRMGGVGTSILGRPRPRPLSGSRRAEPRPPGSTSHSVHPTCEEPDR